MMTENPGYLSTEQRQFTGFELFVAVIPWLMKNKDYKVPYPEMYRQLIAYDEAELDFPIWRLEFVPTYLIEAQKRLGRGPVGGLVRVFKIGHVEPFTEEKWATVTANPGLVGAYSESAKDFGHFEYFDFPDSLRPIGEPKYREADPNASDKPTWAELNYAYASWVIDRQARKQDAFNRAIIDAREKSDALRTVTLQGETLHAGAGIDHMTGLVHMAERSTNAGIAPPLVVMRDERGGSRNVWLASERDELLDDAMKRRNVEESARNVVSTELAQLYAVRDSRTETAAKKIEAFNKANDLLAGFDAKVEAAKIDLAAESYLDLPLDTLQPKLIELLESTATGQQRNLKGALSQQAIDNWAACVDMDTALAEVAKRATLGVIEIEAAEDDIWLKASGAWARVTDVSALPAEEEHEGDDPPAASLGADGEHYRQFTGAGEAKAAYAAARSSIEAVTAANIPTWTVTRHGSVNTVDYVNGDTATLRNATKVIVDCKQVSGVEGRVAQRTPQASYGDGSPAPLKMRTLRRPPGQTNWHSAVIEVRDGETKPVTVRLTGRNLCGPSQLTVTLIP